MVDVQLLQGRQEGTSDEARKTRSNVAIEEEHEFVRSKEIQPNLVMSVPTNNKERAYTPRSKLPSTES